MDSLGEKPRHDKSNSRMELAVDDRWMSVSWSIGDNLVGGRAALETGSCTGKGRLATMQNGNPVGQRVVLVGLGGRSARLWEFSLIRVENQVSGSLSFKTKRRRAIQNSLSATSNDSVNQIASRHTTEYPTSDRSIQSVLTKTGKRQYVPMASNDQHGPNPALGTLRRTHPLMTPEAECQVELSGA